MKAWIARDPDGEAGVYAKKPVLCQDEEDGWKFCYYHEQKEDVRILEVFLDKDFHPEVTFEGGPVLVEFTDQDLLTLLQAKKKQIKEQLEGMEGGFPLVVLSEIMGENYMINHISSLIEGDAEDTQP